MPIADEAQLQVLQAALATAIWKNEGIISCPEVISISQELDQLIIKLMRAERDELV
ncbi:MAG TPA: aspartyl-phosphate phosphatase Spo0E family protein [Oscillospiraceae bacterium]|nr:aspartyl-phosphate phosphatase Spo0E family protein [Oscillospiraceae bacterium]